jgi:hypothetical protein
MIEGEREGERGREGGRGEGGRGEGGRGEGVLRRGGGGGRRDKSCKMPDAPCTGRMSKSFRRNWAVKKVY